MTFSVAAVLQLVLAIGIATSAVFYAVTLFGAWNFFRHARRRRRSKLESGTFRAVTILKPLNGADAELYDNLASYCQLDYPVYQLVFGVRDAEDPAVGVVRRLQGTYPRQQIELVIDGRVYGSNYKVSNLQNMYRAAQHDVIVIADSDVRVPPDYLRRIVCQLSDACVGVVSCLYRARNGGGMPTRCEALFVNTDFIPMVLLARVVEKPTYAFGATMALRRTTLDEIGGFLPLANLLADDYHIGQRVVALGYRSALADLVVETVAAGATWREVLEHQLRWARTYRTCRPRGYFCSIVTHGTLWATLNLLYAQVSPPAIAVAALMYALRVGIAWRIATRYLGVPLSRREALLVPFKDLLASILWLLSYCGDTVVWSGNRFRVSRNGEMSVVTTAPRPYLAPIPYRRSRHEDRPASA